MSTVNSPEQNKANKLKNFFNGLTPSREQVARTTLRTTGAAALLGAGANFVSAGVLFGENNRLLGFMQAPNPALDNARTLLEPTVGAYLPLFSEQAGLMNQVSASNAVAGLVGAVIGITNIVIAGFIGSKADIIEQYLHDNPIPSASEI